MKELEVGKSRHARILESLRDMSECSVCLEDMNNPIV